MDTDIKVALVHDDLIQFGGAEKVLVTLTELFPKAPVYTAIATPEWKSILQRKGVEVKTSFLQGFFNSVSWNRLYAALLLDCLAFESFDFSDYDLVISSSSRFAHGIITKPTTKHLCFMHSPGRMLWEQASYFENEKIKKQFLLKVMYNFGGFPLSYMRMWDYASSQRIDLFVANSISVQNKISRLYQKPSVVIYPFCDVSYFSEYKISENKDGDYYLILSRLVSWKKIDVAIEAAKKTNSKLIIAGDGPDKKRLQSLSESNCVYEGFVDEDRKRELLHNAKALIITQEEDFGITPIEAMASGTPVIAYGAGGVLETVISGVTGEFFYPQNLESLSTLISTFAKNNYQRDNLVNRAREFDKAVFLSKFKNFVENIYVSKA